MWVEVDRHNCACVEAYCWDLRCAIVANDVVCVARNVMCMSVVGRLCHRILDMHASDWFVNIEEMVLIKTYRMEVLISAIFSLLISYTFPSSRNMCVLVPMLVGFMKIKFELVASLPCENLRNMRKFFWRSSRILVIETVRLMRRVRYVVLTNYDVPKKLFCTLYFSVLLSRSHDLLGCVTMSMIPSRVWNWVNLVALNCFISVMVYCFLVVLCSLIVRCLTHCSLLSISTQLTFASPGRFSFLRAPSRILSSHIPLPWK